MKTDSFRSKAVRPMTPMAEMPSVIRAERDRYRVALEQIAETGGVGPYDPPSPGRQPDPWYNSLVQCGEIARTALKGNSAK